MAKFIRGIESRAPAVLGTLVAQALFVSQAAAQCAMCGQATASAGSSPRQAILTFLAAALVLLVPALLVLASVGILLWKHREAPAAGQFQSSRT